MFRYTCNAFIYFIFVLKKQKKFPIIQSIKFGYLSACYQSKDETAIFNTVRRILFEISPIAATQQSVTLNGFLLESNKCMLFTMPSNGAGDHHGNNQSMTVQILKALQKLKSILNVTSCGECQLDQETPGELCQYYPITQRDVYGGTYLNPLKTFMSSVPRHNFGNMFKLCTGHGFWKRISKRGASTSEIIIPSGVRWGQLGMFSRSVLCILHSDTC